MVLLSVLRYTIGGAIGCLPRGRRFESYLGSHFFFAKKQRSFGNVASCRAIFVFLRLSEKHAILYNIEKRS